MDVVIEDRKLRKALEKGQLARKYGTAMARLIVKRLEAFHLAESMADISKHPFGHPHPMTGDHIGTWSIDLAQPMRMLFRWENPETPLQEVKEVFILEILNTHGK